MKKNKKGISQLELIKASENIGAACKGMGISRSQYYKLLKNPEPSKPKAYEPSRMGENSVERILALALLLPLGCHAISFQLMEEGIRISPVSVQKILNLHQLGSANNRFKALEKMILGHRKYLLNSEQTDFIRKYNPPLLELHRKIMAPGDLVTIFSCFLGQLPWLGRVYLYFGLDAYSGYIHGMVTYVADKYLCAEFLKETIFPFYEQEGFAIRQVETSDDPEFFSFAYHPFSSYLRNLNGVKYQRTTVGGFKTNGFSQKWEHYLKQFIFPEIKKKKSEFKDLEVLNDFIQDLIFQYNQGLNQQAISYFDSYPFENQTPNQRLRRKK